MHVYVKLLNDFMPNSILTQYSFYVNEKIVQGKKKERENEDRLKL